ncbi:hypothetical protein HYPBUDRAFT_152478 [Hyphopichia burtonii NRRL Y-1933]|uniref:Uncharacterized protein n=1 Tax=Hyphopichia burtonii NRRL Y-1933 TaxID=984485 RepID=A0A1E4RK03_9ASCO|nr:hypothetical protein HYPBUDRAFT_152478 [Hyphopichia burtonii NRRL Y-1933]ODV67612.1 hypothetical protein HYPBUDRAFT_152478 [Hyphopichia burtonii NRRL Y-1933]
MPTTSRDPRLPDVIKIDDIASGKIEPTLIYNELDRLKVEINVLRNDMTLFIKALATVPDNQRQDEYYRTAVQRLKCVQNSIKEYCNEYYKLLPIINLAQIKLGHEVEIVPQANKTPTVPPAPKPTTANKVPVKRTASGSKTNNVPNGKPMANGSNANRNGNGNLPNQPIVL